MRRVLACVPVALILSSLLLVGCRAKPSEKACKEAIENVRRISKQGMSDIGADPKAAIRSCRGNSSKKSVECMRTAKTLTDLQACEGAAGEKYFQEAAEETKKSEAKSAVDDKTSDAAMKTADEPETPAAPEATETETETEVAPPPTGEPGATVDTDAQ